MTNDAVEPTRPATLRRQLQRPPYEVAITPKDADWTYSGLSVLALGPGESARLETGGV